MSRTLPDTLLTYCRCFASQDVTGCSDMFVMEVPE